MAILKDLTAYSKYELPFYGIINSSTIKTYCPDNTRQARMWNIVYLQGVEVWNI